MPPRGAADLRAFDAIRRVLKRGLQLGFVRVRQDAAQAGEGALPFPFPQPLLKLQPFPPLPFLMLRLPQPIGRIRPPVMRIRQRAMAGTGLRRDFRRPNFFRVGNDNDNGLRFGLFPDGRVRRVRQRISRRENGGEDEDDDGGHGGFSGRCCCLSPTDRCRAEDNSRKHGMFPHIPRGQARTHSPFGRVLYFAGHPAARAARGLLS